MKGFLATLLLGVLSLSLTIALTCLTGCAATVQPSAGDPMSDYQDEELQPQSPTGWSANGTLHIKTYNEIVNCSATLAESTTVTAQFSVTDLSTDAAPEALITWAVEGNFVFRRVSVTNGLEISGTAQAFKIQIFDASQVGTAGIAYQVSVQVAKGSRPSTQQPPTLLTHPYVDENASPPVVQPFEQSTYTVNPFNGGAGPAGNGNGHWSIPIPLDAGAISVLVKVFPVGPTPAAIQAAGTAPVLPQFMPEVDLDGSTGTVIFDPRDADGWTPAPPGFFQIILWNNMPLGQPGLVFSVWLGIDG